MKGRPSLITARAAEIYGEMLVCRRDFCADHQFFRMTEVWDSLCETGSDWSINRYRFNLGDDYERTAGVIAFGHRVKLAVSDELWQRAQKGEKLANFILAHELGHLALGHHAKGAVVKHFQLFSGPRGMSNFPPTVEELEANFAATCFQCGVALEDARLDAKELAARAFSDISGVKKAQSYVRLEVFQRELRRSKPKYPKVIL